MIIHWINKLFVCFWSQQFNEGSKNIYDEDRSGQPRTVMWELIHSIIDDASTCDLDEIGEILQIQYSKLPIVRGRIIRFVLKFTKL